jgi:hypothetical protein
MRYIKVTGHWVIPHCNVPRFNQCFGGPVLTKKRRTHSLKREWAEAQAVPPTVIWQSRRALRIVMWVNRTIWRLLGKFPCEGGDWGSELAPWCYSLLLEETGQSRQKGSVFTVPVLAWASHCALSDRCFLTARLTLIIGSSTWLAKFTGLGFD